LASLPARVVKRSGATEEFRSQSLYDSIKFAVQKRPVDEDQQPGATSINDELIGTLCRLILERVRGQQIVTSAQLAMATTWVLLASEDKELAELMTAGDRQLAYLRVVSSAKRFTRVEDFQAEAMLIVDRDEYSVAAGFEDAPTVARQAVPDERSS
jgi:transcriptional regulator NrdR family protein